MSVDKNIDQLKSGSDMTDAVEKTFRTNTTKAAEILSNVLETDIIETDDNGAVDELYEFIKTTSEFDIGSNDTNKPDVPDFETITEALEKTTASIRLLIVDEDSVHIFKYDKSNEIPTITTADGAVYDSEQIVQNAFENAVEQDPYIIPVLTKDVKKTKRSLFG